MKEETEKLRVKLDRKEHVLQELETKTIYYEKYLQKKSVSDKEVSNLLKRFQDIATLKD